MQRLIVTAPRHAEFEPIEMPDCPADGLLVRARVTAVSTGTEIRVFRLVPVDDEGKFMHATVPCEVPTENGYAMVGEVIAVGSEVSGFEVGDRVSAHATHRHVAAVPASTAVRVPDGVSDEQAVFLNIIEVGHIALRRGEPTPGETVAVIGLGIVGLSTLAFCKAFGFRTIAIDGVAERLDIARRMGADLVISPDEPDIEARVGAVTGGRGADLVIEAASVWPAIELGMRVAARKATVVVVARHTDMPAFSPVGHPYLQKDLTLRVTYGHAPAGQRWDRTSSLGLTLEMLAKGQLDISELLTHRIGWSELPSMYERLDQGERDIVGVIVDWGDEDED